MRVNKKFVEKDNFEYKKKHYMVIVDQIIEKFNEDDCNYEELGFQVELILNEYFNIVEEE